MARVSLDHGSLQGHVLGLQGVCSHGLAREWCSLVLFSVVVLRASQFWFSSIWALQSPGLSDHTLCSLFPAAISRFL